MRAGDTPVPIPNTTVKTGTADGTCLETDRESRWLRDPKKWAYSLAEKHMREHETVVRIHLSPLWSKDHIYKPCTLKTEYRIISYSIDIRVKRCKSDCACTKKIWNLEPAKLRTCSAIARNVSGLELREQRKLRSNSWYPYELRHPR